MAFVILSTYYCFKGGALVSVDFVRVGVGLARMGLVVAAAVVVVMTGRVVAMAVALRDGFVVVAGRVVNPSRYE